MTIGGTVLKVVLGTANEVPLMCGHGRAVLALVCLFCPLGLAGPPDTGEIQELLPANARWQFYPTYVKSVKFDNTGRPWFVVDKGSPTTSLENVKQSVENASGLRVPWVVGASIVLLDSTGRVWLIPRENARLLLGYEPTTGQWIQRETIPQPYGKERGGSEDKHPYFVGPAYESKAGRLYFADRMGIHVFDNGQWTYKFLYRQNFEQDRFYGDIKAFNEVSFAEDVSGRVYIWSVWACYGWTGTIGYFFHDGSTWRHVENIAGTPIERLNAVLPLSNDRVLALQYDGPAILHNIARGDPMELSLADGRTGRFSFVPRPAQTQIDGHVLTGARHLCSERDGTAWLWADRCSTPNDTELRDNIWLASTDGRILGRVPEAEGWFPDSAYVDKQGHVFFARYRRGCVVFDDGNKYPVTDQTQYGYRWLLGEDGTGRIYISGRAGIAAFAFDAPETRPALPTTIYEVPCDENVVCMDSSGRMWAKLAGPEHSFLSVFAQGRWTDCPAPDSLTHLEKLTYIQPLLEGWIVAQRRSRGMAFLFDSDGWTAFKNMRELVESHYRDLAARIDNSRFGRDFYTKMRVDSAGRIWLVEWTHCSVYDGRQWFDVASFIREQSPGFDQFHHCLPLNAGARMLLSNGRSQALLAGIEHNSVTMARFDLNKTRLREIESNYTTRSGLWLDSAGRVWLPRDHRSCFVLRSPDDIQLIADSGFPRFEDSASCIWFLNDRARQLVVRNRDGVTALLYEDTLHPTSAVVEDRPGSVWISTLRGLLHVIKETNNREIGFTLRKVKHYQREVPNGSCLEMFIDRERNLWFYGPGPDNYRLSRVQLPDNYTFIRTY